MNESLFSSLPDQPSTDSAPATENTGQYNDAQLREIYENEEIERFLRLFSTYVNEVKAPRPVDEHSGPSTLPEDEGEMTTSENDKHTPKSAKGQSHSFNNVSDEVAHRFLLPLLPPLKNPPQEFTLNRFKLASQRVYLAIVPHYFPFLINLYRLAKWQDKEQSLLFCAGFWIIWWLDLLSASFFLNLIIILLKHRFLPYPSQSQLRRHREEISYADNFSEQVSHRLSSPSVFGPRDMWRFGRLLMFSPKDKKRIVKSKAHSVPQTDSNIGELEEINELTAPEDNDSDEIREMKRLSLYLMNEMADFHERIKNVFIWRKPSSSWTYLCLLCILFIGSLLTPAKYVLKAISGTLGFVFWHMVPILLAMSPEERLRLPPPMLDVPTDADFAMDLISQRVAAGLEIRPTKLTKEKQVPSEVSLTDTHRSSVVGEHIDAAIGQSKVMTGHIKGMDKALDAGRSLLQGGKQFIKAQAGEPEDDTPSLRNLVNPSANTYTYPAQHSTGPGLITLTPTAFYFSPIASSRSRLTISLQDVTGVKKTGVLKGLEIVWSAPTVDGYKYEKAEKFKWINNRDELFARVISANTSMKWTNVR